MFSAITIVPEAPIHVTGDEKVELTIIVVVEKPGAHAPSAGSNSGVLRYIRECAVSVVVVKRVAAVACHVNVFEPIVVIVAYGYTHSVVVLRHSGKAGFFRHICE